MLRLKNLVVVGISGFLLIQGVCADSARIGIKNAEYSGEKYSLKMRGCFIEFNSRAGGYAGVDSVNPRSGGYRHDGFRKNFDLTVSFNFVPEFESNGCSKMLAVEETDPSTRRLMHVVHYRNFHPLYEGDALATTFTAVPSPRPREMVFCISDNKRVLIGRSIVGHENHNVSSQLLKILRSIRFAEIPA